MVAGVSGFEFDGLQCSHAKQRRPCGVTGKEGQSHITGVGCRVRELAQRSGVVGFSITILQSGENWRLYAVLDICARIVEKERGEAHICHSRWATGIVTLCYIAALFLVIKIVS